MLEGKDIEPQERIYVHDIRAICCGHQHIHIKNNAEVICKIWQAFHCLQIPK